MSVKYLFHKHKDPSSKPGVVAYSYNRRALEMEAGRFLGLFDQARLHG